MAGSDERLDLGLSRRQSACGSQRQKAACQPRVARAQTWEFAQHCCRPGIAPTQTGDIALQRIGGLVLGLGIGEKRDQPDIEVAIEFGGRQEVEHRWQQYQFRRALGPGSRSSLIPSF